MSDIDALREKLREFNLEREWDKFHNPKDLLVALVCEVGELAECYRWLDKDELNRIHADPAKKKRVEEEIADILSYLVILAYKTDIDLVRVLDEKIEKNRQRYPVEKAKGRHSNFLEGFKG